MFNCIYIELTHWNHHLQLDMSLHIEYRYSVLIPNQPVFVLTLWCCALREESANTNCIHFGLARLGHELAIYRTRGDHDNQGCSKYYTAEDIYILLCITFPCKSQTEHLQLIEELWRTVFLSPQQKPLIYGKVQLDF